MSAHVPSSPSVCIHSVCVSQKHRRSRIGLNLVKEYISRFQAAREAGLPYERILLITHENLRGFYEKGGFEWIGKSNVVHGSEPWYEMRKILGSDSAAAAAPQSEGQQIPAGVWEALQRRSSAGPNSRLFLSFPSGILDLTQPHSEKLGVSVNKFDILCPRENCGSIILKQGIGEWVERASVRVCSIGLETALTS